MNWGIIATGRIAAKFAETVNRMNGEGHYLKAVASRSDEKGKEFALKYNIPKYYSSYTDLLQDKDIDAVYIATPNNLHYENSMEAIKHKKHILCEKPFTTDYIQARQLYDSAEHNNVFIMEAFWIAHLPALKQMQQWIQDGSIGKITGARVDYGYSLSPERRYRKFTPELGGGALWDIGIYNLGFLYMIFNRNPDSYTVSLHKNEYDTDDFSHVSLKWGDVQAHSVTSIGIDLGRKALISGTDGIIMLDDFQAAQSLSLVKYNGETVKKEFPFDINGFEYQIREVKNCIDKNLSSSPVFTPQSSISTIKLIQDILYEHEQTGLANS